MTNFKIFAAILVAVGLFITLSNSSAKKNRHKEGRKSLKKIEEEFKKYEAVLLANTAVLKKLEIPPSKPIVKEMLDERDEKLTSELLSACLQAQADSAKQKDDAFRFNDTVQTEEFYTLLADREATVENNIIINQLQEMSDVTERVKTGKWNNASFRYSDTTRINRQIRKLAQLKHVAVAEKKLFIKPKQVGENFEAGYIIGKLKVYQIATGKLVGESALYAQSSDEVSETVYLMKGQQSSSLRISKHALHGDLLSNFSKAVRRKLNFNSLGY
jgi:hypothetical protein